jgi:hypothetical protein
MNIRCILFALLFAHGSLCAQGPMDSWIQSQLTGLSWTMTYKGVLADFHPVTITLVSDNYHIAGYIIHEGDGVKHRLYGEASKGSHIELQERDENDRLTGYLSGTMTKDQLAMDWISADQNRMFQVRAYPESLIKIKTFKPVSEYIEIASTPALSIAVQKMDHGIVSGIANRDGHYTRFEGYCLDGTCSLWNTIIQNPIGAPLKLQMRQRDMQTYKVNVDGTDYTGYIRSANPLVVRRFDNSIGFLDFVYPQLGNEVFDNWVKQFIDPVWNEGQVLLTATNAKVNGRLAYRSSGWIEILEDGPQFTSGLITFIYPGSTKRTPFLWLKKEEIIMATHELYNVADDASRASTLALANVTPNEDEGYHTWLSTAGYPFMIPSSKGVSMATEFNMIYGDDICLLPLDKSKAMIKRKYWKYFGW